MHVDRCSDTFNIGEDEIPFVSTYKYLGCVVDEFLDCSSNDFRGISLPSLVGKIMCMILNNGLACLLVGEEIWLMS